MYYNKEEEIRLMNMNLNPLKMRSDGVSDTSQEASLSATMIYMLK